MRDAEKAQMLPKNPVQIPRSFALLALARPTPASALTGSRARLACARSIDVGCAGIHPCRYVT